MLAFQKGQHFQETDHQNFVKYYILSLYDHKIMTVIIFKTTYKIDKNYCKND